MNRITSCPTLLLAAGGALTLAVLPSAASAVTLADFETTLGSTFGDASLVGATFNGSVPQGSSQLLLSTIQSANGPFSTTGAGPATGPSSVASFVNVGSLSGTFGSAFRTVQTFTSGGNLTFTADFLTLEPNNGTGNADYAFLTLINNGTGTGSIFTLATPTSATQIAVNNDTFDFETGYINFTAPVPAAGTYTIGFGVVDVGTDVSSPSALLLDNVAFAVPEPDTLSLLLGTGLVAGGTAFRRRRQRAV